MPCPHGNPNPLACVKCKASQLRLPGPPPGNAPLRTGGVPAPSAGRGTPNIQNVGTHGVTPVQLRQPPTAPTRSVHPAPPPPRPRLGEAHLTAFKKDLESRTEKFTLSRSSALKLVEHLELTKGAPKPFVGANETAKVQDARNKCANPNDSRLTKYAPALRALVRVWGTDQPYAAEAATTPGVPAATKAWTKTSMKSWIDEVQSQLDKFKKMAVLDALAYPGDINPDKKDEVKNRAMNYKPPQGSAGGTMGDAVWLAHETAWNPGPAKAAYDRVTKDGSGVCSSFAKAAAWVLTSTRAKGPRVELVSFTNPKNSSIAHVFVLVGRTGGDSGGKLPDKSSWGDQTWIVDAWLGAMGYDIVYDIAQFPRQGYLQNLKVLMERKAT